MSEVIDECIGTSRKRRGFIVWCLIVIEALGSIESVWAVTFGVKVPPAISASLASVSTDLKWLHVPVALVGAMLSALMAWYFYNMSRKLFAVAYAKLGLAIAGTILQLIFNAPLRHWVASTGLWPLLISPIICIALIAYVHYLDGNDRLEA
jgi:predicted membrane protein